MTKEVKGLEAAISIIAGFGVFKVFGWAINGLRHLKKLGTAIDKIRESYKKLKLASAKFNGVPPPKPKKAPKPNKYAMEAKEGLDSATKATKNFMGTMFKISPLLAGIITAYKTYSSLTLTVDEELEKKIKSLEAHQARLIERGLPAHKEKTERLKLEIKLLKEKKALIDAKSEDPNIVAKPDEMWQYATSLWDKQAADKEFGDFNAWLDKMSKKVVNQPLELGVKTTPQEFEKMDYEFDYMLRQEEKEQKEYEEKQKKIREKKEKELARQMARDPWGTMHLLPKPTPEEIEDMEDDFHRFMLVEEREERRREKEARQKALDGWRDYFETLQDYEVKAYQKKNEMNMKTLEEEKALQERLEEIRKKETTFKREHGKQALEGVSFILKGQADLQNKSSKKGFENWKNLAIAEATITGITSAMNAYKSLSGIPIIGVPLATAAAATVAMTTAQQIGQIQAQTFTPSARGGYDIPQGVNPLTQLHEREMVLPAEQAEVIRQLALEKNKGKYKEKNVSQFNFNISSVGGQDFMEQLIQNRSLIKALVQ